MDRTPATENLPCNILPVFVLVAVGYFSHWAGPISVEFQQRHPHTFIYLPFSGGFKMQFS